MQDNVSAFQSQAESSSVAGSQPQAQGQSALPPAPSHKLMALHPTSQLLVEEEAALEIPLAPPNPGSHPVFPTHLLLRVLKWNHKHHIPSLQLQLVTVSGHVIVHGLDLWGDERRAWVRPAFSHPALSRVTRLSTSFIHLMIQVGRHLHGPPDPTCCSRLGKLGSQMPHPQK